MMKTTLTSWLTALAFAAAAHGADVTVKLSKVHLCCKGCVNGAQKAVSGIDGVTAAADQSTSEIDLTGPDTATVQKAVDALVKAGYFGKSSDPDIRVRARSGTKNEKVQSLAISGVHLCCGKCVSAVDKALKSVEGVKSHTAEKNAKSFTVTGDFNDREVFAALHKAGLSGKVETK